MIVKATSKSCFVLLEVCDQIKNILFFSKKFILITCNYTLRFIRCNLSAFFTQVFSEVNAWNISYPLKHQTLKKSYHWTSLINLVNFSVFICLWHLLGNFYWLLINSCTHFFYFLVFGKVIFFTLCGVLASMNLCK